MSWSEAIWKWGAHDERWLSLSLQRGPGAELMVTVSGAKPLEVESLRLHVRGAYTGCTVSTLLSAPAFYRNYPIWHGSVSSNCTMHRELLYCWVKRLKVKGRDIYIGLPPLTGKPRPAAVYNWSGVLTGNDTSSINRENKTSWIWHIIVSDITPGF